jgi:hypothetical protein
MQHALRAQSTACCLDAHLPAEDTIYSVQHCVCCCQLGLSMLLTYPRALQAGGGLTKPDPNLGALPLWCGRLLPEDPLVHTLPLLVKAASMYGIQHERKVCFLCQPTLCLESAGSTNLKCPVCTKAACIA